MRIQAIRGVKDIMPDEIEKWRWVENKANQVFNRYGFNEIRLPIFEKTKLFSRGIGETTDIVEKEMYTFEDRGGEKVTLRPEGTASVVRALLNIKCIQRKQFKNFTILAQCFVTKGLRQDGFDSFIKSG